MKEPLSKSRLIHWFIRSGFLLLLLYILSREIIWTDFVAFFLHLSFSVIFVCFLIEWGFFFVESWRIRVLSYGKFSIAVLLRTRLLSACVGNALPGFGSAEILRIFLLDRFRPDRKIETALLLFANRLYGLFALGPFIGLPLIFGAKLPFLSPIYIWFLAPVLTLLPFIPLIIRLRWGRRLIAGVERHSTGVIRAIFRKIFLSVLHHSEPKVWLRAVISSTITNAAVITQTWIIAYSFDIPLSFLEWSFYMPLVAVAAFLPVGFGAVGPQDAALISVAQLNGLPFEPFVALSLTLHLLHILSPTPGLFFIDDLKNIYKSFHNKISLKSKPRD